MSQWARQWLEPSVLANVVLAAVAIWYSIETQRLRRTAIRQLELTRESASARILPYVLAGIHRLSLAKHLDAVSVKQQLAQWAFRRIELPGFGNHTITFDPSDDEIVEINSTTDQVASHVLCLLFDHRKLAFRISPPFEVIAPRESGFFPIATQLLNIEEVLELIRKLYEDRADYLHDKIRALSTKPESVLIPVFFDLGGRLYAAPRPIHWNADGSVLYGKSDLIQPEGYPDIFAPPFPSTTKRFGPVSPSKRS